MMPHRKVSRRISGLGIRLIRRCEGGPRGNRNIEIIWATHGMELRCEKTKPPGLVKLKSKQAGEMRGGSGEETERA